MKLGGLFYLTGKRFVMFSATFTANEQSIIKKVFKCDKNGQ